MRLLGHLRHVSHPHIVDDLTKIYTERTDRSSLGLQADGLALFSAALDSIEDAMNAKSIINRCSIPP